MSASTSTKSVPTHSPPPPIFVPPVRDANSAPVAAGAPVAAPIAQPVNAAAAAPSASTIPASLSNLATFQSLLNSNAHYGTDLWDSIPSVADQSEASKAHLARLSRFLKDKADLDKQYAHGLKKLVLKLQVPDVPRVADIPNPPQAAAQAAAQAAQAAVAGGTSLASSLAAASATNQPAGGVAGSADAAAAAAVVVDPRSFDRFMMAFRNLHMTLATNFEILSAKIVEQVYKPLSLHRDAHALNSKRLLAELDKYTVTYQKHLEGLLASRAACQKACQESEAMRRKLDHATQQIHFHQSNNNVLNELVGAFKADSASLVKKALAADAKYIQHVKTMRGFRQQTDSSLAHVLDQFEQLEASKLTANKEVLHHYLVIQQQMFGSNVKNLSAVQNVLDKINPATDVQYFILCNKSGKLPIPLPEYQIFRGHPNFVQANKEEQDANNSSNFGGSGAHGDISSYSSAQMSDSDSGSGNNMDALSSSPTSTSSSLATKTKSSGWGWLNTIAAALPGNNASKNRPSIDHDSEAVLSRGSNYYDNTRSGSNASAGAEDFDGSANAEGDNGASPPMQQRRGASFNGENSEGNNASGGGDEVEEKSPERQAAEQQLSDYFDAITGRMQLVATPTAASAAAASAASPSPASPSSSSSSSGSGHVTVTYAASRERDLTPEELARSDALFSTAEGRKSFASVLNRQRNTSGGLRLCSRSSLQRLAQWTRGFLDRAQTAMHVNPTQLVMIMSQSFFTEEEVASDASADFADDDEASSRHNTTGGGGPKMQRTYLISLLKDHPLWREMRFWEEAFFDAFNSKIRKSAAAKVHKWHSDIEQAESLHTRKQVCFSTLSTFSHNMNDFKVPPRSIVEFVEKLGSINELDADQMMMLRSMEVYQEKEIQEMERKRRQMEGGGPEDEPSMDDDLARSAEFERVEREDDQLP